jgi:iron-sulfur cluster assembly protein
VPASGVDGAGASRFAFAFAAELWHGADLPLEPAQVFDITGGPSEAGRVRRPNRAEQTVLTLTNHAQDAVRTLTADPQAPESAGLRIASSNEGLELMVVAEPQPGDALIDDQGARVFVEAQAAALLTEQTLDAEVEGDQVNFFLAPPDETTSPFDDVPQ